MRLLNETIDAEGWADMYAAAPPDWAAQLDEYLEGSQCRRAGLIENIFDRDA